MAKNNAMKSPVAPPAPTAPPQLEVERAAVAVKVQQDAVARADRARNRINAILQEENCRFSFALEGHPLPSGAFSLMPSVGVVPNLPGQG